MRNNQQLRSTQENGLNPHEWLTEASTPPQSVVVLAILAAKLFACASHCSGDLGWCCMGGSLKLPRSMLFLLPMT